MADEEERTNDFFAFDLVTGTVVEHPEREDDGSVGYKVRYFPHKTGYWATIGDGEPAYSTHSKWFQHYHWNTLLDLLKGDKLNQGELEFMLDGVLGGCFPEPVKDSQTTFVTAVKSGLIGHVEDYLPVGNR